jgi:hypothetical protein
MTAKSSSYPVPKPSESSHDRELRIWSPLLGHRYAELRAVALRSTRRGYLGALVIVPFLVVVPFMVPNIVVAIVVEIVLVIASPTWLLFGLLPMYRVAKRFAAELRTAGVAMNHSPALNIVEMFERWLARNNLSAEQVAAIGDREQ